MSAMGQKQTFAVQTVMSASPPKADIHRAGAQCAMGLGMWPSFTMARQYICGWAGNYLEWRALPRLRKNGPSVSLSLQGARL
jgi:hypothetical protein